MLIIQASNIHIGGGAVLLSHVIEALIKSKYEALIFVDERYSIRSEFPEWIRFVKVKPSVISRLKIEISFIRLAKAYPNVQFLFFGNLPPLFLGHASVYLLFQNLILLKKYSSFSFSLKTRIKQSLERIWLRSQIHRISRVFVQSNTVKNDFISEFPRANVEVFPFFNFDMNFLSKPKNEVFKKYDFIYVASFEPHKNFKNLLVAWSNLYKSGHSLKLLLVTSELGAYENDLIDQLNRKSQIIFVEQQLSRDQLRFAYLQSKALIYPSFAESFGLPLLEARKLNLGIVASDMNYVYEMVTPDEVFDPADVDSIAQAVLRFNTIKSTHVANIKTASEFLKSLNL